MCPDDAGERIATAPDVSHPPGTGLADPATAQVDRAATPVAPPTSTRRRRRGTAFLVLLVLVAGGLALRSWTRPDDIRSGTTLVDAQGMAARHGISVTLLAVTAAGGLIEFRYQVVDPDKASRLLHDRTLSPALVVEETGETLVMAAPAHQHGANLRLGGSYFFLMANAHSALRPGRHVTVVIGDARLEHIAAQG